MPGKIAVAMSGGVDSSVAALLLKNEGHEVVGLTMALLPDEPSSGDCSSINTACCSFDSVRDAQRVCWKLEIPHHTLNMRGVFQEQVIAACEEEWRKGRTPNPCVLCNSQIKWGALLAKVYALGFEFLATGHYSRIDKSTGRPHLLKGTFAAKDQSYFLWAVPESALKQTLFPLGSLTKPQARALAQENGLPVHDKAESQEICFIPDKDAEKFWSTRNPMQPGEIVDRSGQVLGTHKGLAHYTVGQRKGIGHHSSKPQYVVAVDPVQNRVVIGDDTDLFQTRFEVTGLNWIGMGPIPGQEMACAIRIRYRAPEQPGRIKILGERCHVEFDQPQRAITPGQSAVFYQGDRVLGGGVIEKVGDEKDGRLRLRLRLSPES